MMSRPPCLECDRLAGELAAIRAQNVRLLTEIEQRRREESVFESVSRAVNASLDSDTVLQCVATAAKELCESDQAVIALRDSASGVMTFRYWAGARYDKYDRLRIEPGKGAGGTVLQTRAPFRTANYAEDPRITKDYLESVVADGVVSQLVVPVHGQDRVEGLLYVANRVPRPFSDHDEEILTRLAQHAAIAIRNAALYEEAVRTSDVVRSIAATESALRASEGRYRLLAENVTDVLSIFDMNLRPTYVSPSVQALRGYSAEEAMAQTLAERMTATSVELVMRAFAEELGIEHSGGKSSPRTLELELVRKDGTTIWTETKLSWLRDERGAPVGIVSVARDISERKRLEEEKRQVEEQLRQAQKLDAIGRLAGGVAHDFNNLLTVITGRSQMLLDRLRPEDVLRHHISPIYEAGKLAGALTRQLLAFGRKQALEPKLLDLNQVVIGVEDMLRRLIPEHIELQCLIVPGAPLVRADPGQLEQVLVNLVVNARDAMPSGGQVEIATAITRIDKHFVARHPGTRPGVYATLTVRDTGSGMDGDTLANVFEPFFTTKGPGKGTGLGLSTVYGIVAQHEGCITVESKVNVGSTFRIYLPRAEGSVAEACVPGRPPQRGGETVLLVEDDDEVRRFAHEILDLNGYSLLEAARPSQALTTADHHAGPIHLLLTDVVMPEMSGRELGERLTRQRSETKVLYMSGYPEDQVVSQGVLNPGVALLWKPFNPEELALKVREALDAPHD